MITLSCSSGKWRNSLLLKIRCLVPLFFLFGFSLHAQHDLSLIKTSDLDSAGVGDTVTFVITVVNEESSAVTGVEIEDILPAGLTHVSNNSASTGTSYTLGTGIWDIGGSLSGTGSISLEIKARIETPGVHFNNAQVHAMDGFDVDSTPDDDVIEDDDYATACVTVPFKICSVFNDTVELTALAGYDTYQWMKDGSDITGATNQVFKATEPGEYTFFAGDMVSGCSDTTCCPVTIEEACFDLALDKQLAAGQSATISPGDDVTFTVTVHNQGDYYADSILITDYLPSGLTNNSGSWVGNDTLLTIADGGLPAGGLAPDATVAVDITLTIGNSVSADSLVNYAEISDAEDVSRTDNRDIDSTPDTDDSNDGGGASNSAADDYVDGDGSSTMLDGVAATDEDDHDPEVVYICPTITNPSADAAICSGDDLATLSVATTNDDTDGISFVYFLTQQTGSDMYSGGTSLGDATAVAGTASLSNVSFPANNTTSPITYYTYAILNPTPTATSCRPFQEIEITVYPHFMAGSDGNTEFCEGETTAQNLTTIITIGDAGGTWSESTSSGADISDPTSVDFSGVSPGVYIYRYIHPASVACPADTAIATVTVTCLLYTSPSPRDRTRSRMPSSA